MKREILTFALFVLSGLSYGNSLDICKKSILDSSPYGKDAVIGEPVVTQFPGQEKQFWSGKGGNLVVTGADGVQMDAIARCTVDTEKGTVMFLSIAGETVISRYKEVVSALEHSENTSAAIASINITEQEHNWLKQNGNSNLNAAYSNRHPKEILESLDAKDIIIFIPSSKDIAVSEDSKNRFQTIKTDLSKTIYQTK